MLELPPPIAFGFPEKFSDWRPDQLQGIEKILTPRDATTRVTALTMPTGSGKSLVYVAGAILYSAAANVTIMDKAPRAVILTSTKALEDQNLRDFAEMGMVDIRGMNSYICKEPYQDRAGSSCDEGPCRFGHRCVLQEGGCTYYDAVKAAQRSTLVVTNYAYWLASYAYGQGLGDFDLIICDEAHDAADQLSKFLSVTINEADAIKLGTHFPDTDDIDVWGAWAKQWFAHISHLLEKMPPAHTRSQVNEYRTMKRIAGVFQKLTRVANLDWIVDRSKSYEATFDLIDPGLFKEILFRGTKRVVLTSATLRRKTLRLLGIGDGESEMWECPSRFAVARRPIYYIKGNAIKIRVDHKMSPGTRSMWISGMDDIIGPRIPLGWKGIIHTVSYPRAREIYAASKYKEFMLIHDSSTTMRTVAEFRKHDGPCIIVSPALMTGWDFAGDECRYQIIAKIPSPDSRVPIVKARQARDPEYGPYIAMQQLVQGCGRGMRSADDWCENFIIDDHFDWMRAKYKSLLPKWFLQSIREEYTVPAPLEF